MNDVQRWRLMAAEMRNRAAQAREKPVVLGFLALAADYDRLPDDGAGWTVTSEVMDRAQEPNRHPGR